MILSPGKLKNLYNHMKNTFLLQVRKANIIGADYKSFFSLQFSKIHPIYFLFCKYESSSMLSI